MTKNEYRQKLETEENLFIDIVFAYVISLGPGNVARAAVIRSLSSRGVKKVNALMAARGERICEEMINS